MMRQLEKIIGESAFRDGLREYLKTYAYKNSTWLDLVRILDRRTPENLEAWSHTWVEERGRPVLGAKWRTDGDIEITQRDPMARGLLWPQHLRVTAGYADRTEDVEAFARGLSTVVRTDRREQPRYVLGNGGGLAYGLQELDERSKAYLLGHLEEIADPLTRCSAWVSLWENVVEKRIAPQDFTELVIRALPKELDEQNAQLALGYLRRLFWFYLTPEERTVRAARVEALLRAGIELAVNSSAKSAWFSAFRSTVTTHVCLQWL
jgi:aminopeptidase N